jgi:hypothetical protein
MVRFSRRGGYAADARCSERAFVCLWDNKVTFSVPRGFYNAAQSLILTADARFAHQSTDGTKPSATNGFTYTNPIAITPDAAGTRGTKRVSIALNANAAASQWSSHVSFSKWIGRAGLDVVSDER